IPSKEMVLVKDLPAQRIVCPEAVASKFTEPEKFSVIAGTSVKEPKILKAVVELPASIGELVTPVQFIFLKEAEGTLIVTVCPPSEKNLRQKKHYQQVLVLSMVPFFKKVQD